jgi:hypothetical protein
VVARARLIIGVVGAALALGGLAWAVRTPVVQAWWDYQAQRPLTEEERAALERCEDPSWKGLMRVAEQDLDVPCAELWLAEVTAAHLESRELEWTIRLSAHPERSPRGQLRTATVLFRAGEPAHADLAFLVADPEIPEAVRTEYVDALIEGRMSDSWAGPALLARVDLAHFEAGELAGVRSVQRTLRLASRDPEALGQAERARRVEGVLGMAGLGGDRLERALQRRDHGYSWQGVPPHLEGLLADRGSGCQDRASAACLRLAADLLDQVLERASGGVDGGPELSELPARPPAATLPRPLWEVLLDADPALVTAAAEELGALGAWVALAPESERPGRLLGSIADARAPFGVEHVRAGELGDPLYPVTRRRGAPWTSALAALAVGEVAGVEVSVHRAGDGVVLRSAARSVAVGACGNGIAVPDTLGPAWPARAVLAQAVVEALGAALRLGNRVMARRLAALAERLDPIGAGGVSAVVASTAQSEPSDTERLGLAAGAMATGVPAAGPTGAEAEREARAAAWAGAAEQWALTPEPASCPGALGP